MFKNHQPNIEDFARQNSDNFAQVVLFVSATIQQMFHTVPAIVEDVRASGLDSKHLWGSKHDTWRYTLENKDMLFEAVFSDMDLEDKLLSIAEIPGIGLVKAGFVLQLCTGEVGCLDVNNLRRFGLSAQTFKMGKVKYLTARKRASLYIKTCVECGGSETLWDEWCQLIADKYPQRWRSAHDVSQAHEEIITGAIRLKLGKVIATA
ncbi:MAG: hypothetical protein VW270_02065 [Candidatus Poseidoniales archaeon]